MSVTKKINGNLTISTSPDPLANVTISTHTVYIDGNLQVGGDSQTITQTNTDITDNIITLNKGETGPGVTIASGSAGIQVDRGNVYQPILRWYEPQKRWQITNDGSTYGNIAISTGSGSGATVADDTAPALGGNLDTRSYTIYSSTQANVTVDTNLAIRTTSVAPTAVTGYNIIYSQTPSGGGSGLYVTTPAQVEQELATKRAAIKYSIIFG
jgi:hypothetical protein